MSANRQMLGAMLFAVAKNSGDWEILNPAAESTDFDPFILGKALDILEPLAV